MSNYDKYLDRYLNNQATEKQLDALVKVKLLTKKEAEQIKQTKIDQEQETEAAI